MGINQLSEYGGLYQQYRKTDIPSVDVETVKQQDAVNKEKKQQGELNLSSSSLAENSNQLQNDTRSKSANLQNISLTFNKEESYDYIGSDSNLSGLDTQKAVSDMKKDSILSDYQYFVGSGGAYTQMASSADGMVLQKLLG